MLLNDDTQFHKKTKKTPNTPRLNVSLRYRLPLLHTLVISDGTRQRIESSASPDPSISEDLINKSEKKKLSVKNKDNKTL